MEEKTMTKQSMKKLLPIGIALCAFLLVGFPAHSEGNSAFLADVANGVHVQSVNLTVNKVKEMRLVAEVPAGKTLKAYSVSIKYDPLICMLRTVTPAPGTPIPPMIINTDIPGLIKINGFDLSGIKGHEMIPLIDMKISGKSPGTGTIVIVPKSFGEKADDQFIPDTTPVPVTVK